MLIILIISLNSYSQGYDLKLKELQVKYNTLVIDNKFDIGKELVGKIINFSNENNKIELNFVNNQHLILSKNNGSFLIQSAVNSNSLLKYKSCKINNTPIIVILVDGYGADGHGLVGILVKEKNKDYKLYEIDTYELYNFVLEKGDVSNQEIILNNEKIGSLSYNDPKLKIFVYNSKFGILRNQKEILKAKYDSIQIYGKIIASYSDNKINLLSTNGKLLVENIKSYYQYTEDVYQILDSINKMSFIDTLGIKSPKPINRRYLIGNDTEANDTKIYEINKNNVISIKLLIRDKDLKKVNSLEDIEYNENLEKNSVKFVKIPRKYSKLKFINNESKIIFEDYWYYVAYYKPFPPNFLISKKKGQYGLWNFESDSIIIPFEYENIQPYTSYLSLKKNGLYTFYPCIGIIPKYKKLDNYIEWFARFECMNGKKGWVNRKGEEFFDDL